jgi:hypothetical protein
MIERKHVMAMGGKTSEDPMRKREGVEVLWCASGIGWGWGLLWREGFEGEGEVVGQRALMGRAKGVGMAYMLCGLGDAVV